MTSKWQNLLERTEVAEGHKIAPCSEAEILEVETGLNITLPSDYKAFSKVFGGGQIGDCCIRRLDCEYLSFTDWNKEIIKEHKEVIEFLDLDVEVFGIVENVVNTGFYFGEVIGYQFHFYFDLHSYSLADMSCDIYLISFESRFGFYELGRDFFLFINNFAFGENEDDILGLIQKDGINSSMNREAIVRSLNRSPKIFTPGHL
ncbi:SMI1/KNR4 family protein [Tumidithrix elongata RA019]|uniref:SMI1/KNR4 family protein n=1 Tax=Tumidithrix elongata BACA0141 TaxID=2716417 RepID=A0AAW9PWD0_9CYAN|nr:SMI1/KNR4 family protein [Tumidithrix elongata RA019]